MRMTDFGRKNIKGRSNIVTLIGTVVIAIVLCIIGLSQIGKNKSNNSVSYTMDPITIDAVLQDDGSLQVTENRTYNFDSSAHGVYWILPTGMMGSTYITPIIVSCGEVKDNGEVTNYARSYSKEDKTFSVDTNSNTETIKLYNSVGASKVTYQLVYSLQGLATRYADVGDLYWKFVSDGWDVESDNVTCTIHLPVPADEHLEPEQNTWAFGHGNLAGNVEIGENSVTYTVPSVGTSDFAEARILFPASWISGKKIGRGENYEKLQYILQQEEKWAQEANTKRIVRAILIYGSMTVLIVVGALSLALAWKSFKHYKQMSRSNFQDMYFRDMPSNDHPAVIGYLYNNQKTGEKAMTAEMMHLVNIGVLSFDPKNKNGSLILNEKKVRAHNLDFIDTAFVKGILESRLVENEDGDKVFEESAFSQLAELEDTKYYIDVEKWKLAIERRANDQGYLTPSHPVKRLHLVVMTVVMAALTAFCFGVFFICGLPWFFYLTLLWGAFAIVGLVFAIMKMQEYSQEAIDIIAKTGALKKWLTEFTNLKEAVPTDVTLWNNLLVMACMLGVSKEVLEQLKVAEPALLQNADFVYYYPWMFGFGPQHMFFSGIGSAMGSAYHNAMAGAAFSGGSSTGGGGGFSGGGGGGFGGGGGGGAF